MKPGIWLFLLLVGFCLGCECEPVTSYEDVAGFAVNDHSETPSADAPAPLNFGNLAWLYLAEGTSVDFSAFEKSGGKTTKLVDSEGNNWDVSLQEDTDAMDLAVNGFMGAWFPSYGGQQFFCKVLPAIPAPVSDPMIDGSAVCSVYLMADEKLCVWLRRNADIVPCPDTEDYKDWLPRTSTVPPANSLL